MSYFFLEPVSVYVPAAGSIEEESVKLQNLPGPPSSLSPQSALVVAGMDLTLYDVHIFEEVSPGSWTPVGSTVGLDG